jgi:5-methylcytosine-specific restriction endonuclease McrA
MIKLTSKSKSGSTTHNHLIMHEIGSPKTWAASLLLRDYYWRNDPDNPWFEVEAKINFSRSFLTRWKEKHGTIKCTYCPKTDLVIEYEGMSVPKGVLATIDHVHPISRGGGVFDLKNVVPCCSSCNQKKGNKLLHEFQKTNR